MREADVILEIPARWFDNPLDADRHQRLYASLLIALADLGVTVRPIRLAYAADAAPRLYKPGQLVISFHSRGSEGNVLRLKESYLPPYYSVDPIGFSGFSQLTQAPERFRYEIESFPLSVARDFTQGIAKDLRARNLSKYPQSSTDETLSPGFLFLPLQTVQDPVATLAAMDQLDALEALCAVAAATGTRVVTKRHPLCSSQKVAARLAELDEATPHLTVSSASVLALIDGADLVVGANSGVLFEALLADKPVISFARSDFEMATHQVADRDALTRAVTQRTSPPSAFRIRFVAWYLSRYCVHAGDPAGVRGHIALALENLDILPGHFNRDQQALFSHFAQIERQRRLDVLSAP